MSAKIHKEYISQVVKAALKEDLSPLGDITTKNISNKKIIAKIVVGQNCIIGGLDFAKNCLQIIDSKTKFIKKVKEGGKANKGKVIAIIVGKASNILKAERVALNFLGLISGVATITNKFVKRIKGMPCKICCTRKTLPNLRLLQKYGVRLGGGKNHRFNLSDEILIKDNHIAVNKNIVELVKKTIKNKNGKKITVEVDNLKQLKKIIGLKFDRVLFDNMTPTSLKKAVKLSRRYHETEASGGITLKNVRRFAVTGVNRLSVGQLTHSAPNIDFRIDFSKSFS